MTGVGDQDEVSVMAAGTGAIGVEGGSGAVDIGDVVEEVGDVVEVDSGVVVAIEDVESA